MYIWSDGGGGAEMHKADQNKIFWVARSICTFSPRAQQSTMAGGIFRSSGSNSTLSQHCRCDLRLPSGKLIFLPRRVHCAT